MTRTYPGALDAWHSASFYAGKSFSADGGTTWPEDVGDEFEAIQNYLGFTTDTAGSSTITARMLQAEAGYRFGRSSYTPSLSVSGGTAGATLTGNYFTAASGKLGLISVTLAATGTWSGSTDHVEISLPPAWTSQATFESAVITGFAEYPSQAYGAHFPCIGVVHPGTSAIRVISSAPNLVLVGDGSPGYCTATVTTNLFTCATAHNLVAGDPVRFRAADAIGVPSPLVNGTTYYVIASGLTTTDFKVSTTPAGSTITLATGTVMCESYTSVDLPPRHWLAVDGVNYPFNFTSGAHMYLTGFVLLA